MRTAKADARRRSAAIAGIAVLALAGAARSALAHDAGIAPGQSPLSAWPFAPEIITALLLTGALYASGIFRSHGGGGAHTWRHISFFGGLGALFLALQSPIEPIADHVFTVHQVEHMLLRTVGPMLLMLSTPQAALMRGLPRRVRASLVAPLVGSAGVRRTFGVFGNPVLATVLFIAVTYFWMVPRYHDLAILDEPVHYLWHVTLLVSGLFFFWRVFDPRPQPLGASLPARLLMIWFAVMGNILLGTYLSLKSQEIYGAYDLMGRMFGLSGAADETYGGLTMWIPGSMMFMMAALAVIHRWLQREHAAEERNAQRNPMRAIKADAFVVEQRPRNRALAIGLTGFVLVVLGLAVSAAILYDQGMTHP